MAISYVSYSSVNGGGNVGNVLNAPAGAVAGNLIVAFSSNISGAALTPPAGWTTIHSDTVSYLGWHIYAAGETSYTFTGTYGYQYYITGFCLSGNAPTSPVDVGACSTYSIVSGGSSITTPSVTTTLANDFVVSVWQADMYINPPTALVPQSPVVADLTSGPTSDGFNGLLAIGHVTQAAAGASPTQTAIVTCSSSVETICATLALFANSTPLAPTLVSPIGGVYANLASTPTFVWTGNFPDGTLQRDYAFRMKISGAGSYSYWNATTPGWQSTIVWNVGGAGSLTFPASSFTNGNTYNWSVATESTASIQGPFATDAVVVAQVAPVVTVTGPTGTVTSSSPLVTWTSTLGGSAVQIAYQVRTFTSAQYGAGGFSPGTSTASDDSGVVVSTYPFSIVATSLTNGAYQSYVQVTGTGPEQSAWAYTGYTVTKDEPATPTITATATTDGATGCPVIALTASCNNNILSAEDASFEPVGSALAVGSFPQSIAIDPAGAFAYTANYGASTVTKINLATFLTVGSALAVGSLPQSIAIDPAGAFAYTANYGASTVTKINLATFLTVGSALAVGSDPYSIAIDPAGAYAYVANAGDSTVTKINLSTFLTVGSALAVGSDPYAIAIDPAGTFAYVANAGDSTVTKINLSTFLTVGSALAVGSVPCSIAVDPAGAYAYVANNTSSTVTKINLSTFLTVGSALAVGSGPYSIAVDPAGAFAYTANYSANTVTKINLSTFLTVGSALAVGSFPYSVAVDPAGTYAYVANHNSNTVTKINLATGFDTFVGTNCTLTQSATKALDGAYSLQSSATTTGGISAATGYYAVLPNTAYSALVSSIAAATSRTTSVGIQWYTSGYVSISTSAGSGVANNTSTWTQATVAATSPATAAFAKIVLATTASAGSELQYWDEVGLFLGTVSTWTAGGFVGSDYVAILRSDGVYVRGASLANPYDLNNTTDTGTIEDFEVTPGVAYTYTAVVVANISGSIYTSSTSSATGAVTLTTNNWWLLNPLVTSGATFAALTGVVIVQIEESAAHYPIGSGTGPIYPTVVSSGFEGQDGTATAQTFTAANYAAVVAILTSGQTAFLSSPFGDGLYVRFGPAPGGMSSGVGNTVRSATLLASAATAPARTLALSWVSQPRPPA